MKPIQTNRLGKAITTSAISLISFVFFLSCSSRIQFANSTVMPTAEGSVKVKRDGNNNYSIDINIKHLANPNKLVPAKDLYVVWAETKDNGTKNLGRLNTSTGLFSSTLKSSLRTVSPVKPTMIFITAENDAGIQYPGSQVIMTTSNF
jgi:hypothetical protein